MTDPAVAAARRAPASAQIAGFKEPELGAWDAVSLIHEAEVLEKEGPSC